MNKSIGKCPFCNGGQIIHSKVAVNGKQTNVYSCTNASWYSEDGEMFELSKNATCSFRIWGNSLQKWGKRSITPKEVKSLLQGKDVKVKLYSFKTKKEYYKYICLNKEYGISVIWEINPTD